MENLNILVTDEVMSLAELKEDNLFLKIPKESIKDYIEKPMDIGTKVAEKVKGQYKGMDIKEICLNKGIKINLIEGSPKFKFIKIRAEYMHHNRQLNIYNNSIKEMERQLDNMNVIDIHVAHELFHYLEYEEIGLINEKMEKVKISSLFNRNRYSTILNTREIAAHIFCKEMLNLNIHPKWIDYMYLLATKEISYLDLKKYLVKLNEEVTRYFGKGSNE